MGNNNQLHHFTDYLSVVFFIRCLYFYSGFIVLSAIYKLDLKNISIEKCISMPPVFTLLWKR